jgi:hypothetical protein
MRYFLNGREISERDALVPGTNQVRDGVSVRVPTYLADATRAPPPTRHRPGFVDPRAAAYAAYDHALTNAWKGDGGRGAPPPPDDDEADEDRLDRENDNGNGRRRESDVFADAYSSHHPNTILTADGNALSLHRPGFRIDRSADARARVADARKQYETDLVSAYKTRDSEGYGEHQIGQSCTVRGGDYPQNSGEPGKVTKLPDGRVVCAPVRSNADAARDRMTLDALYAERDRELSEAWRIGK